MKRSVKAGTAWLKLKPQGGTGILELDIGLSHQSRAWEDPRPWVPCWKPGALEGWPVTSVKKRPTQKPREPMAPKRPRVVGIT